MSFLVVAAGHSGTKWLAVQLGKAPGWTVEHEPDSLTSARLVAARFANRSRYGEVNSFLLTSARHIPADCKAVLLRNPYAIARSVARTGHALADAVIYVRESLSTLDGLVRDGFHVIRFADMVSDASYLIRCAFRLGVTSLREEQVTFEKLNEHKGTDVDLSLSPTARLEFDDFIDLYGVL